MSANIPDVTDWADANRKAVKLLLKIREQWAASERDLDYVTVKVLTHYLATGEIPEVVK